MKNDIEHALRTNFQTHQLSESRVDAVLEFCEPARQISRWKRRAFVGFVTTAAAVIALCAVILTQPQAPITPLLAVNQPVAAVDESDEQQRDDDGVTLAKLHQPERFQIIAVKIHADPCGRCRKIAPVFADLQNEFSDDPVLFLTFDLTSKESRRQADRLSSSFEIENVFDKHRYTGVIVLATPDGQIWDVVDSDADIALAVEVVSRNLISG